MKDLPELTEEEKEAAILEGRLKKRAHLKALNSDNQQARELAKATDELIINQHLNGHKI